MAWWVVPPGFFLSMARKKRKPLYIATLLKNWEAPTGSVIPGGINVSVVRIIDYRGEDHAYVLEYGYPIPCRILKKQIKTRKK